MLARWVFTVWGAWLGALGLAAALTASRIWNPNPILPLGLSVLTFAAGLGLVIAATVRLIRGPRRDRALAGLLMGTAPFWFLVGHILMAMRPSFDRHVPPGWPSKVLLPLARPLADLEARWVYPERTPGKWVTMVGAPANDARAQVAAMDRHVEAALARLDQSATWPILWYRGPLFVLRECAVYDIAFGSEVGQQERGADGLTRLDRHEVAHCVITQNYTARSDPPTVLMEGWAQANQGTPAEELARAAWDDREKGRSLTLRQLVAPDWYWYSGPAAYNQGGPLVNYLLRVYGSEGFLKLYTTCQQATFEADCRATLGIGLDELDAAFWADTEQVAGRAGPPSRRWLKGLKLDPSIDSAAWDAFLADYFAAAARLVAPYDQVRLKTFFRIGVGTEADRDHPVTNEYEERFTLLRSEPFARVWHRVERSGEWATLAHPDHSLRAFRELTPESGPWTLQAYQRAPGKVESDDSNHNAFIASHGGAALLQFPQSLEQAGTSLDLEVTRLITSTNDGHPRLTLGLRSPPGAREADRQALTFVFAVDDSFVIRSEHYELPKQKLVSDCRFEYDHPDGIPVLRSFVTTMTIEGKVRTIRLDVEECVFGPIPAAEFALEPFLASLGPGPLDRQHEFEPSTATLLDWYWLAFVAGGISLASGSGLALGSRYPDRRVLRSD
jgi:hypothetical protein